MAMIPDHAPTWAFRYRYVIFTPGVDALKPGGACGHRDVGPFGECRLCAEPAYPESPYTLSNRANAR
jgi:hypothetical protein